MTFKEINGKMFCIDTQNIFKGLKPCDLALIKTNKDNTKYEVCTPVRTKKSEDGKDVTLSLVNGKELKTTKNVLKELLKVVVAEVTSDEKLNDYDDYSKEFNKLASTHKFFKSSFALALVENESKAEVLLLLNQKDTFGKYLVKDSALRDFNGFKSSDKRVKLNLWAGKIIERTTYNSLVLSTLDKLNEDLAKEEELAKKKEELKNFLSNLNKEIKTLTDKALKATGKAKEDLAKELKEKKELKTTKEEELAKVG